MTAGQARNFLILNIEFLVFEYDPWVRIPGFPEGFGPRSPGGKDLDVARFAAWVWNENRIDS